MNEMSCNISAEQLALFMDGLLPAKEQSSLKSHLEECSACQHRIQQLKDLDANLIELGQWSRLRQTLGQQIKQQPWQKKSEPWYQVHLPKMAPALVCLVLLLGFLPIILSPVQPKILQLTGDVTFSSAKGNLLRMKDYITTGSGFIAFQMGDGHSRAELGPDTKASVTGPRELSVERGVVWNDVYHDPSNPYRIISPFGDIIVRGTKFEMIVRDTEAEVRVSEGTVELHSMESTGNNSIIQIHKGFSGILSRNNVTSPKPYDTQTIASWRKLFLKEIDTKDIADIVKKNKQ